MLIWELHEQQVVHMRCSSKGLAYISSLFCFFLHKQVGRKEDQFGEEPGWKTPWLRMVYVMTFLRFDPVSHILQMF